MDNEQKVIKTIVPALCPHCSKEIMVAHRVFLPIIEWALRPEDLDKAKLKVIEKVKASKQLSEDERKSVLNWLEQESTKLGPAEVDTILSQILPKQE